MSVKIEEIRFRKELEYDNMKVSRIEYMRKKLGHMIGV